MAWFAMNKKTNGTSMNVSVRTPEGVQISLGKINEDSLLTATSNVVTAPTSDSEDWFDGAVDIGNYYKFGKLIPASSSSGEHIYFTPDAIRTGKDLKSGARFYQADGNLDKDLNGDATDPHSLKATAYVIENESQLNNDYWNNGESVYTKSTSWKNTNDDGYYIDIPIWFRTSSKTDTVMGVEGFITRKNGTISPVPTSTSSPDEEDEGEVEATEEPESDSDALYKAVRVAVLDSNFQPTAAKSGSFNQSIVPLRNSLGFDSTKPSIVDSRNYTVTRDVDGNIDDETTWGITTSDGTSFTYEQYLTCANTVSVVTVPRAITTWSTPVQYYIRIWLDGDDKDCWNQTAGQDWCIYIRFIGINSGL